MAAFQSFLGHQSILYTELMTVCERLELVVQLSYSALEVKSDSATVVSWIHSQGPVRWDYAYLLRRVCALIPSSPISIRPVFREATSVVDFLANWVYTHRASRHFLYSRDLLAGLSSILYLDAQTVP